ncbi:MAG: hypothetical protein IM577_03210 [Chitinophagaceae bacterium]|nr:hypothetical protein [Chitinophagaceae bacterium]
MVSENTHLFERFEHIKSSVSISSFAINELYNLQRNYANNPDVKEIIDNHTFRLFRASLSYMISNEFSKIFDDNEKNGSPKLSSIYVLNKYLPEKYQELITEKYKELDPMHPVNNIIYDVKKFRDKSHAHSDKHILNKPFSRLVYSREQLAEMNNKLKIVNDVLNQLSQNSIDNIFGEPATYNLLRNFDSNTTINFIKFTALARRYYNDNSLDAMNKGYFIS